MNNFEFGNYLCESRNRKKLSQGQLGEMLGVTNKAVSRWENGYGYPSSELMLPLAKALGVSIEELYSELSKSKTEKTRIARIFDRLSNKQRLIGLVCLMLSLIPYVLFIILGTDKQKTEIIILAPVAAVIIGLFIRLLLFIFEKNPMCPARYTDIFKLVFALSILLSFVMFSVQFAMNTAQYSITLFALPVMFYSLVYKKKNNPD